MPQPVTPVVTPNRVKIRIAFSGNNRETTVDIDSLMGCKAPISGSLYPTDMTLVSAIMKLVDDAKTTYPAGS